MFGFLKKMSIGYYVFGLLAIVANVSKFTTCIFLNNQPCKTRPTLINFYSDEYSQDWVTIHLWLI